MLAKGLFNKKSVSVSTWHVGWHHTWEKERCKSVFSHKLQSWKCFHIRCFIFLIYCSLMESDTWKFSPVNFLLLLQQGCSLENLSCKVASSKQWSSTTSHVVPPESSLFSKVWKEICFATEFAKFKQYLNPACCLYFFDSGVAGNIGSLHSLWILQNPTCHRNSWELVIEDNPPEEKGSDHKRHGVNYGEMNTAVLEQAPGWILPSKRL